MFLLGHRWTSWTSTCIAPSCSDSQSTCLIQSVARRSASTRVKFIRYYLSRAEELFSDLQALGGAAVVQGKADAIGAP